VNILHIHPKCTLWSIELSVAQQSGRTGERQVITLMHSDAGNPNPVDLRYRVCLNSPLYYDCDEVLSKRLAALCGWPDVVHVHTDAESAGLVAIVRAVSRKSSMMAPLVWDLCSLEEDGDPAPLLAQYAHMCDGVTSPTMDIDGLPVPFLQIARFSVLGTGSVDQAVEPLRELDVFYQELIHQGIEL